MGDMKRVMRNGMVLTAGLMLAGCGWLDTVVPDRRPDYKTARTVEPLEVPPDLASSTLDDSLVVPEIAPAPTATLSDYRSERQPATAQPASGVLPEPDGIRVMRDGDKRWLVVPGDAGAVWTRVREFWLQRGFTLTMEDPRVGIMETAWAENRADIPEDPIRRTLGRVLDGLYSAATRDKFRVRLERGEAPGTTEVILTHRGMEEKVTGSPAEIQGTLWQPRPSDPELEVEMLRRLMLHLGVVEQRADSQLAATTETPVRAELVKRDGQASLTLFEDFSRAWRRTGVALDRTGFAVEDRDREQGIYFVRYIDPDRDTEKRGLLSWMRLGRDDSAPQNQYQIKLTAQGANTDVSIRNEAGEPEQSRTAERILNLLHEQLR
ncbi:MAG: outer membrane protein assembly factor BamC [Gammaproteobacteria bacterium]|nr:outer membrane protein assembly factor BamC [Gammaproteobacteria bacterium]